MGDKKTPSQNTELPLSNLKEERPQHGSGIQPKYPFSAHIFLTSAGFGYNVLWAGRKLRAISYYMAVLLQSRRASPSITLPDAQGFTNPLAITSAFQGFHKKCNSCESLKCLLKWWLTSEIITPFSLKTGWSFPCGFMLLEGILDNLWLFNPCSPWEQCKCGWWTKEKFSYWILRILTLQVLPRFQECQWSVVKMFRRHLKEIFFPRLR